MSEAFALLECGASGSLGCEAFTGRVAIQACTGVSDILKVLERLFLQQMTSRNRQSLIALESATRGLGPLQCAYQQTNSNPMGQALNPWTLNRKQY